MQRELAGDREPVCERTEAAQAPATLRHDACLGHGEAGRGSVV